jgi:hypothetical protein
MESTGQNRRFPAPWRVEEAGADCYEVRDANGFRLVSVHYRDDLQKWSFSHDHLTSDEARRIAKAIARLPEFLKVEPAFAARRAKRIGRFWKSSHPYHVALTNTYINENYDEIVACCRYNNVPFDPTGEILDRAGTRWRTYQFARQFDAIRFWDKFEGRWMIDNEFHYPERPKDLPSMKPLKNWPKFDPRKARG